MKERFRYLILLVMVIIFSFQVYSLDGSFRSTMVFENRDVGTQIFFVTTQGIAVQEIWFSNSNPIEHANIIIESSQEIVGINHVDNAYEYETIGKLGLIDDELMNFKIKFRVESKWVTNNSDKTSIYLYYYDNIWEKVDANYIFSDSIYDYFEAYPKRLNYLAIAGKPKEAPAIVDTKPKEKIINKTRIINKIDSNVSKTKELFSTRNIILFNSLLFAVLITGIILYYFFKIISHGEYLDNVKEAEEFIDEELAEGVSRKEIEKDLEEKGWPKRFVENLVHSHHLSPDIEVKLKASIQNMRNNMMSDEEIKKSLVTQGWASELIDEIYEEFTS